MLGLRLIQGFELGEFRRRTGIDFLGYYSAEFQELQSQGLLTRSSDRIHLTLQGLHLADSVMAEFF